MTTLPPPEPSEADLVRLVIKELQGRVALLERRLGVMPPENFTEEEMETP